MISCRSKNEEADDDVTELAKQVNLPVKDLL